MKLKKISSWKNFESIESKISKNEIRSWLLENGPITKRIKKNGSFKLHLIQDELSFIEQEDKDFIDCTSNEIKLREVILFCNDEPIVFAQTIIPVETISKGLKQLGNLGNKPLVIFSLRKIFLLKIRFFMPSLKKTHVYIGEEKQNILLKVINSRLWKFF